MTDNLVMCGFVGIIYKNSDQAVDRSRLIAARDTLEHRGPDESGLWCDRGVGFGHRRLSVLDLKNGQQPMVDDRYSLVYNGEIYNFKELQQVCKDKGQSIQTSCDTEVLFKLLNVEGLSAIDRCNGMFAFAHWDTQKRQLLMARDRLGQKPLYWFKDETCCVFGSELKAVLRYLERKFSLDPIAIDQYFARGYILSPRTIFKQIQKLPAACSLELDANTWEHKIRSYWDYSPVEVPGDEQKAIDQLDELLSDAVAKRLVSDVPLGCLLSGGIDSTLMTAMAARTMGKGELKTFSIGFDSDNPKFNELPYAKLVADHHHCQFNSKVVQMGDFLELVEDVTHYFDEPFSNFAMFPMRRLAQMCKEQLTVVISGQGGDELAGGYEGRYSWTTAIDNQKVPPTSMDHLANYLNKSTFAPWNNGRAVMYSQDMMQTVLKQSTGASHVGAFWMKHAQLDPLNQALYADVKTNLPDYLVCVEERMTMSASLEARNPMLDHHVVNYMLSMPTSMKVKGKQFKWALFELAKRYGPIQAIDRPKRGFTPPLSTWVVQCAKPMGEMFKELAPWTSKILNPQWQAFIQTGSYTQAQSIGVYYVFMFAKWCEKYADYIETDIQLEATGFNTPATPQDNHWHQCTMAFDGITLGEGRFFAHLFNHFEPGDRLLLTGDEDGWFSRIAKNAGKNVVRMVDSTDWPEAKVMQITQTSQAEFVDVANVADVDVAGTLVVGKQAAIRAINHKTFVGKRVVFLIPFHGSESDQIPELFAQMQAVGTIAGQQVVQLAQAHGALVVRCEIQS